MRRKRTCEPAGHRDAVKPSVANPPEAFSEVARDARLAAAREQLQKLERRDWWLWIMAVMVMLLLTLTVLSMNFPGLIAVEDPFFRYSLDQAVRGLVGLVLLFNVYSIYQQATLKRTRRQLSEQIEATGALQTRAAEFYRLATTDALTGLANRRTAEQQLTKEMARSRRRRDPLAIVVIDLNSFKQINDRHGHAAGDLVLCEFAKKLNDTVRGSDLAVRMGGDEFLVVLPECTVEQAPILLARLRSCEANFQGVRLPVEFSWGCVSYVAPETPEEFLERADQALYADKRARKMRPEKQAVHT